MSGFVSIVLKVSKILHTIAGVALTIGMGMTVADVLGRAAGYPIRGTYEIVGVAGIVVIGCAIPFTSWERNGHVYMEIVLQHLPKGNREILNVTTRLLCIALFAFIGFNLFQEAAEFSKSGEGTLQLVIPFYPFAYGLSICCFVECLVLVCNILNIWGGKYD